MDPFKHYVSKEGCSSSESGWTRYLASPMQDDFECSEENYNNNHNFRDGDDVDGEGNSDDSMVSDASSAPSYHQHNKHRDGQASHGSGNLKHDKSDYSSKHSSRKEVKKEAKKIAENSGKSKRRLGAQAKYHK